MCSRFAFLRASIRGLSSPVTSLLPASTAKHLSFSKAATLVVMGMSVSHAAVCLASATVAPASLSWNFVPVGGRGGEKSVTLTNTQTTSITISSITLAGANPGDFKIYSQTCGSSLAASASCTATIVFSPTTTGNRSATLQFSDSATNSPQVVALSGLGVIANSLSPNPSSLSFASTAIGSSTAAQTVLMTNATSSSVTFSGIGISGANAGDFSISKDTCSGTVVAGSSCSASVVFKPTASGTRAATLQFTDSASNSPQSIALSGTGAGSTNISATPSSLTFASTTVGSASASRSTTLSNATGSTITISSITISGTNAGDFSISSNSCGSSLASGSQCATAIVFKPTATGTRTATLQFIDSASNSPQLVALSGTGANSANIFANPPSLGFASTMVGSVSASQSTTLSNSTASTITISSIAINGANAGDFSISSNSCAANQVSGGQCTIAFAFKPTATGTRMATLQFTDNASNSPQSVALSGTGTMPAGNANVSPEGLSWAFVPVGGIGGKKAVTLTNNSTTTITISSIALVGTNVGDFRISSQTCGSTLAASASCTVSIAFAPTTTGTRSAMLQFTDTAGNNPQTAALSGLGVAAGNLTPNPSSLTFAITGLGSSSSSQSVVLANSTTSPVSIGSVAIAGADAGDFFISSTTCGSILVAGGNCITAVVFAPVAVGTRSATLQFADSSTSSPQAVALSGTGVSSALTITPSFANLHPLNTQTFTANLPVTWSASCGSITTAGVYTAPASSLTSATCEITATTSSGTSYTANATADVETANYTARKGGGGQLGLQSNELALTPSDVNASSFGLQWSAPVDAWVNAQPLYLNALSINGVLHNVVFVVTANDSVYAFDGDTGAQLWSISLIPAGATAVNGATVGFTSAPLIGILSTPVIDPTTNTMYVVAETSEQSATYFPFRLHALDLTTGAEKFGGPVLVNDTDMAPMHKLQRPGLTLANGNVYVAIGSMEDIQPYHGFLFAFNAQTLAQEAVWNVTPTGSEGGIWMGASAPSVDADGNIFVTTGNGSFDGTSNFGEAAVKLSPSLQVLDYFAPYNFATYDASDVDLGSGSAMVVPYQNGSYPNELIACGKPTPVYVLDRDNLGKIGTTSDNVIQRLDNEVGAPRPGTTTVQACFTGPAMWGQNVYFGGKYDVLKMFVLNPNTGLLSSTPVSQGTLAYGYPGADPVISSNGPTDGILWTVETNSGSLIAVDATDLTKTLYSALLSGGAIRWTVPTPVNGHVYVGEAGMVFGFGLN